MSNRLPELISSTIKVHEDIEELQRAVRMAIDDGRFKLTLEDHRKFRELIDDCGTMLDRSWRGALQIPVNYERELYKKINVENK